MVDVGGQIAETHRVATGLPVTYPHEAGRRWALISRGHGAAKGDVLGVARIAAIQGAKRTSDLIPLCHPLALTRVCPSSSTLMRPTAHRVRCTRHR